MTKTFALSAHEITPIATGRGACLATDKITVEGRGVGYFYRAAPNNPQDSGWCFFAGDEDDGYMDEVSNHGVYDVNTIANYTPAILPYLDAPIGAAFYRDGDDFKPDPLGPPEERD